MAAAHAEISIILEVQGQKCGNILDFTKRRKAPQRRKI